MTGRLPYSMAGIAKPLKAVHCWLERQYNALSDLCETGASSWYGFVTFMGGAGYSWWQGKDPLDEYLTNVGTILLFILLNQSHRSDKAMHVKLDGVDPVKARDKLEAKTDREIEEARDLTPDT